MSKKTQQMYDAMLGAVNAHLKEEGLGGWTAEKLISYGVVIQAPFGAVTVDPLRRGFALGCVCVRETGAYFGAKWQERLVSDAVSALKGCG